MLPRNTPSNLRLLPSDPVVACPDLVFLSQFLSTAPPRTQYLCNFSPPHSDSGLTTHTTHTHTSGQNIVFHDSLSTPTLLPPQKKKQTNKQTQVCLYVLDINQG